MRDRDLEVLAYPIVLETLAGLAMSAPGREAWLAVRPLTERAAAERALDRQWDFFRLVETRGPVPLASFPDVRESLALACTENAVLAGERLIEIRTVLRQARTLQQFLRARVAEFPVLTDLPAALHPLPELERALARMLDDAGALVDDASPRLAELRAALRDLRQDIEERLGRLVAHAPASDVADRYVTVRNNRFVVPLKAGASGRVAGVVQDRSASGETLFLEPLFAIELNNRLLLVRKEEESEELRLLALLTAQVGAFRHELGTTVAVLAEIDRLAAGAELARRFRCSRPTLGDDVADLRAARHPVLLLAGRPVVPTDVRLTSGRRALVLSGPNTGGKSVALKTFGLLTLMAQSGMLIPADEGSVTPFVTAVFTDLGDDQSVERNLSTFSSHIVNLIGVFAALRPPALVLLDEPGVGTDPEEGAALAVALVDRLLAAGALVAAATHYAPVKLYALNDPRIELAAVEVDPVTFEPRFRLLYGSIGESLGLAMARRLALPADVLDAAEARRADLSRELGDAIARLESTRRRLEDERAAVGEERRALAELERERSRLVADLDARRRTRWSADLDEARQFLRTLKAEGRALLESARERAPERARDAIAAFARQQEGTIAARAAAVSAPDAPAERPVRVGDDVEVRGTPIRGELVEITGETARVVRGTVSFRVPLAQLRPSARASGRAGTGPRPIAHAIAASEAVRELQVLGLRARDAVARVDQFLDAAQRAGVPSVRVVHGVGTGALKRAIADYLAGSAYCTGFHDAPPEQGGGGVTIVELL